MYGGASKLPVGSRVSGGGGRGGGSGPHNRRSSLPPAPRSNNRPANRLSLGGGSSNNSRKDRNQAAPTAISGVAGGGAAEESFSLVSGKNSNSFAVIVKLAPGLLEELKKSEAAGVASRIRFDPSEANANGNVIEVGSKEFKFTWSSDELCDIFEEQQSGENGNGLLVQSGTCCRKVNVHRILDESTTNHVKMRSVEAERKLKSRRAIVLDHGNPSMKTQLKQMAAVESSPWKNFKQKKEPLSKKQKTEVPQAGVPTKPTFNSTSASNFAKGRRSSSPLPSPLEQNLIPSSALGSVSNVRGQDCSDSIVPILMRKETIISTDKEIQAKSPSVKNLCRNKESPITERGSISDKQMDLRILLIQLLKENPKGISFKALEKAVNDTFPNSDTKMEPLLKEIASFQGPGRYILKPGADVERFKNASSDSRSFQEDNHQRGSPSHRKEDNDVFDASILVATQSPNPEVLAQSESKPVEELIKRENEVQGSPSYLEDKKVFHNNDERLGSSSDSGSQSDSESESSESESESESRSHSLSRSRSRSPLKSGSGSSSESETEASSNSKEGSDMDVDIMQSDDEKDSEKNNLVTENGYLVPPESWLPAHTHLDPKKDGDFDLDTESQKNCSNDPEKRLIDDQLAPFDTHFQHNYAERSTATQEIANENCSERTEILPIEKSRNESLDKSRLKPKIGRKESKVLSDDKPERAKRLKVETADPDLKGRNLAQLENSSNPRFMPVNKIGNEENIRYGSQQGVYQPVSSRPEVEPRLSWKKTDHEVTAQENEKNEYGKCMESVALSRNSSEGLQQAQKDFPESMNKTVKNSCVQEKQSFPSDTHYKSQGDLEGNRIDDIARPIANTRFSPRELGSVANGKKLQRELSDLELGELRESFEETVGDIDLERKGSLRVSEIRASTSDHINADSDKGKLSYKNVSDLGKFSPPNLSNGGKSADDHSEKNHLRSYNKISQQSSMGDHVESGPQSIKIAESNGKLRQNDTLQQQHKSKSARLSRSKKEGKAHSAVRASEIPEKVDAISEDNIGPSKRESSSEEDSLSYSKYEKEKPDLRGPIQCFTQYKDYVQEYCEKYNSYCALNKMLETYRKEFQNMGKDLESVKGADMERYKKILSQLKDSYKRCGPRHKRLKKIFIVLHEELKNLKKRIKEFAVSFSKD